jgi:hypothetical protein
MKNKLTKKKPMASKLGMQNQLGNDMMSLDGPMSAQSTGAFQRVSGSGTVGGMSMTEDGAKAAAQKKQKAKGLKR